MATYRTPNRFIVRGELENLCYYTQIRDLFQEEITGRLTNVRRLESIELIRGLLSIDTPQSSHALVDWLLYHFLEEDVTTTMKQLFIEDTVRYITTGHRKLSLATHRTMLHYDCEETHRSNGVVTVSQTTMTKEEISAVKSKLYELGDDIWNQWLSHPDGYHDLLHFCLCVLDCKGN